MTRMLFLGLNFAPEEIGVGHYSSQMIAHWIDAGNDATVVTTKPYYPQWRVLEGFRAGWQSDSFHGIKVVRCPIYVPRKPTGLHRLVHYATFGLSSLVPMILAAIRAKPDLVMTTSPSLVAAPVALVAAKFCGARTWLHVQDFEVRAAFATGLLSDTGAIARLARAFEKWMYRSFDTVSSISPQMCARLEAEGVDPARMVELRNWADLDQITPLPAISAFRERWDIKTPHVALYSGNIANKQGLDLIVEAARLLRERDDLTFVICGNGSDRAEIEAISADLTNMQFRDLQPRSELGELLGLATIHMLPQLDRAADLMLPSKLANMLASGRPVVATAKDGTGLSKEVAGVGIATPPGDAVAFADAIVALMDSPERHAELSTRARERAEERWNKRKILDRFIEFAATRIRS